MRGVKPDEDIRRPMQWDASPAAGFTSGTPWRALNNDIATVNVQAEADDPGSLFNHYRRLIHLRMDYPALRVGDLWLVDSSSDQVYAFLRSYESEAVLVLVNLGKEPVSDYSLSLDKGPLEAVNTVQLSAGRRASQCAGGKRFRRLRAVPAAAGAGAVRKRADLARRRKL